MTNPPNDILTAMANASCLYSLDEVETALKGLAGRIATDLEQANPILLPIMNGGLSVAASLMRHLHFPLQLDYLHITRYRDKTSGGEIDWIHEPKISLSGRNILLVDDLLDHGITLNEAVSYCKEAGAASVRTAVLILKQLPSRPGLQHVDYFALEAPDRYLFGYGMDYKSYWRNAPGIYAVAP